MLYTILDKYTKVLQGTNCFYEKGARPSFNKSKSVLSKYNQLSTYGKLYYHLLSRELPQPESRSFDNDCYTFYEHMIVDTDIIDTTRRLKFNIIKELVEIDFLIKIAHGTYCINVAYVHNFSAFQLSQVKNLISITMYSPALYPPSRVLSEISCVSEELPGDL